MMRLNTRSPRRLTEITVLGAPGEPDAILLAGGREIPSMLGRAGLVPQGAEKAEGDGATPVGRFAMRQAYYRPDRRAKPRTSLVAIPLHPSDLWCDDPGHTLYNRPVNAPFAASVEQMWMDRRSYDLCIVLDYNLARPEPGKGSAIFFHLTRYDEDPPPTEGCVAVGPQDMDWLLPRLAQGAVMDIRYR